MVVFGLTECCHSKVIPAPRHKLPWENFFLCVSIQFAIKNWQKSNKLADWKSTKWCKIWFEPTFECNSAWLCWNAHWVSEIILWENFVESYTKFSNTYIKPNMRCATTKSSKWHSTTTWTEFWHFCPPPLCLDSFYTISLDNNRISDLLPLPPSTCSRSYWMVPRWIAK